MNKMLDGSVRAFKEVVMTMVSDELLDTYHWKDLMAVSPKRPAAQNDSLANIDLDEDLLPAFDGQAQIRIDEVESKLAALAIRVTEVEALAVTINTLKVDGETIKEKVSAIDEDLNNTLTEFTSHVASYKNWRRNINDFTTDNSCWETIQKILVGELVFGGPKTLLLARQLLEFGHFNSLMSGNFDLPFT